MTGGAAATRVLVTGGTGYLGRVTVPRLLAAGYTVRVLSRRARPPGAPPAVEWATADLATGAGLAPALAGVDVVLHGATDTLRAQRVDVDGTRRLVEGAVRAGAGHLLYPSIVGIDRPPLAGFPYYRAKVAAERLLEAGPLPLTVLRATQFHPLVDLLFLRPQGRLPVMVLPKGFVFQTVDEDAVAARLVAGVAAGPQGRVADVGGPEVLTLEAMARAWLRLRGKRALILPLSLPLSWAAGFRAGLNTCPDQRAGGLSWEDWVRRRYGPPRPGERALRWTPR